MSKIKNNKTLFMKLLRKIGTGIISLGLISTFYTPDAKATLTILKWEMPSNQQK